MKIVFDTYSSENRGEGMGHFERCAGTYNQFSYIGKDGLINPYDQRYLGGGVHMGRTPEWYRSVLSLPGAYLIEGLVHKDDSIVQLGHTLFFTGEWPSFADDLKWTLDMPGFMQGDQKPAYGYLTVVRKGYRNYLKYLTSASASSRYVGINIAQEFASSRRKILTTLGIHLLLTEVFVFPVPNVASLKFHMMQGAVCLGGEGVHQIPEDVGKGTVKYAQFGIAMPGWGIEQHGGRNFSVVKREQPRVAT